MYHFPTFFGTHAASLSATLAMLHIGMTAAFLSTCITNGCTSHTYLVYKLTTASHKLGCQIANPRTFLIQFNTPCHHFYIFFL
jgi:hypothetical protein